MSSRSSMWRLLVVSLGTLIALVGSVQAADEHQPGSVALWYAAQPPLPELAQFDWVVLEPGHASPADVKFLREQGSKPFAYLSIGELDGETGTLEQAVSSVRNEAWNSQVMDLTSAAWRNHIFTRAGELRVQGYVGLFLDTLDSFLLLPEEQREPQRQALATLLRELKQKEPSLKLFFNRGFEVLPELQGVAAAVAVESIYQGWDAGSKAYTEVSASDREWLQGKLAPLRTQGVPVVAIDYLPAERRDEARNLAARLLKEGFVPFVTQPDLDYLGISSIEVQPRRIAVVYDPAEGDLSQNPAQTYLGGLLEYMGYRVDYLPADATLPRHSLSGLYAGVITWMTAGPPAASEAFDSWISQRLDERMPLAIIRGLPLENDSSLKRLGLRRSTGAFKGPAKDVVYDKTLFGNFEAPFKVRLRELSRLAVIDGGPQAVLSLTDSDGQVFTAAAIGDWGGIALEPYVIEESQEHNRWMLDPFAFIQRALRLPAQPRPDATTENGRRIATVHIDGDGFVSRAEVTGSPYSGNLVLSEFIRPHPFLTSVSVIEGEVGPKGMYPYLAPELEPIARKIFADAKVEVATHTYSHPFFLQPELASKGESFEAQYGYKMAIPGYDTIDFTREVVGSRDYINSRLTTPDKPVKMLFWPGDALPSAATVKLAYDSGLANVNGGNTALTNAFSSLTRLSPLIRPTDGGIQYYAPIINENVYTNLWQGPYYGFRGVIETFALTENPRRLRGLHLYYHFYSATKQASLKVMDDIYRAMEAQKPISLWMSDYIPRMHGLYQSSLARRADGSWQVRGLDGLRTLRLDPALGWPDLSRSQGVAGVRDLPQGRYVHLSAARAVLALRADRDPRPALEEANLPLSGWRYLNEREVRFSFRGEMPLHFSVRASAPCQVTVAGRTVRGKGEKGLWYFELPMKQVDDGQLICK